MSLARRLLFAVLTCLLLVPASSRAQAPAAPTFDHALQLYNDSRFNEAIGEIESLLRGGALRGDQLNQARELRARCLAKLGRRLESQEAYKAILSTDASYRADPVVIPPDEMEPFKLALKDFQAEQLQEGKRFPASIGFLYGVGQAVNQDLVDLASESGFGEADDFEASNEFGYSVRFPLAPKLSVDVEVSRLRAETQDKSLSTDHAEYTAAAIPIVTSVFYNVISNPRWRINGFGGLGALPSEAVVEFQHDHLGRLIPVQIVGRKTGIYLHVGVEGELLASPRFAVLGRILARYANSGELDWNRPDFEVYQGFPASTLGGRSVDFSGLAAHIGVRAYIGY